MPNPSQRECTCLNADPLDCMCTRYQISRSLASITGACTCHCHHTSLGTPLSYTEWLKSKKGEKTQDSWRSKSNEDRQRSKNRWEGKKKALFLGERSAIFRATPGGIACTISYSILRIELPSIADLLSPNSHVFRPTSGWSIWSPVELYSMTWGRPSVKRRNTSHTPSTIPNIYSGCDYAKWPIWILRKEQYRSFSSGCQTTCKLLSPGYQEKRYLFLLHELT